MWTCQPLANVQEGWPLHKELSMTVRSRHSNQPRRISAVPATFSRTRRQNGFCLQVWSAGHTGQSLGHFVLSVPIVYLQRTHQCGILSLSEINKIRADVYTQRQRQAAFGLQDSEHYEEVENYRLGRYISSNEAVWRILDFPVHERYPSVMHLQSPRTS